MIVTKEQLEINDKAKLYIEYFKFPIIPTCSYNHKGAPPGHVKHCNNPGKVPLTKDWTIKTITTLEEFYEFINKVKYFNIGVPLGTISGLIRLDIDGGIHGLELLNGIKKGDELPKTVKFKSPNNGLGYLYRIPKKMLGKVKFHKFAKVNHEMEHVECALLGDGQQTVLPPSIGANGIPYEWEEGHAPWETEIAEAPKWLLEKMIKDQEPVKSKEQVIVTDEGNYDEELLNLSNRCTKLKELLEIQKTVGLDEDNWFKVESMFVNAGRSNLARYFSALSSKHNKRSDYRIDELEKNAKSKKIGMTRCTTLGCDSKQIEKCFKNPNKNSRDEITNSPGTFLLPQKVDREKDLELVNQELNDMIQDLFDDKYLYLKEENLLNLTILNEHRPYELKKMIEKIVKVSGVSESEVNKELNNYIKKQDNKKSKNSKANLKKIGFIFDKDGYFKWINSNIFARHINENFDFLIFNDEIFYEYSEGVWKQISFLSLSRKLRDFLHSYMPDIWSGVLEDAYISALKREIYSVKQMNPNRSYINLKNGMYNLDTYKLEPHNKELFSSIQVPIEYNPETECPEFQGFLEDVLEGDKERISLVQEILGYCLTSETRAQKGFILLGEGSNGKSVLADLLIKLCGIENVSSVSMKDLENGFARYNLVDKTLNISTENEVDSRGLDTQYLKAITTGDMIRVEEKYKPAFEYKPMCKLVFAVNSLPYSRDKSHGYTRRLVIVTFNKKYKVKLTKSEEKDPKIGKADPNLLERLETEMDGILNFAIEGLKRLRENNFQFTQSREANKVLEEYKEEINVVLGFVREYVDKPKNSQKRILRGEIRVMFNRWCQDNNHKGAIDMNSRKFWKEFRKALDNEGISHDEAKSNGKDYFTGISLRQGIRGELDQYLRQFGSNSRSGGNKTSSESNKLKGLFPDHDY